MQDGGEERIVSYLLLLADHKQTSLRCPILLLAGHKQSRLGRLLLLGGLQQLCHCGAFLLLLLLARHNVEDGIHADRSGTKQGSGGEAVGWRPWTGGAAAGVAARRQRQERAQAWGGGGGGGPPLPHSQERPAPPLQGSSRGLPSNAAAGAHQQRRPK